MLVFQAFWLAFHKFQPIRKIQFLYWIGPWWGLFHYTYFSVSYGSEPNLWSIFNFQIPECPYFTAIMKEKLMA